LAAATWTPLKNGPRGKGSESGPESLKATVLRRGATVDLTMKSGICNNASATIPAVGLTLALLNENTRDAFSLR